MSASGDGLMERALERERRARGAAEQLLDEKSRALYLANEELRVSKEELEVRVREATTEVRRQQRELERHHKLVSLGEITGAIAHEVNQPLASIVAYTSAALRLLEGSGVDQAVFDALERSREMADLAAHTIRGIRSLVSGEEVQAEVEDLGVVVKETVERLETELRDHEAVVRVEMEGVVSARFDRGLMRLVVINLVRNSIEASGDGGCEMRIGVIGGDGVVRFELVDNGSGFDRARLGDRDVFEAFVTTKARGMGLGLSICRSVIETYRGRFGCGDRSDGVRGAVVWFDLPAEEQR